MADRKREFGWEQLHVLVSYAAAACGALLMFESADGSISSSLTCYGCSSHFTPFTSPTMISPMPSILEMELLLQA